MRCFVVPSPALFWQSTVLSSHRDARHAYKAVDAQDEPSAWVVRQGDLRPGAVWLPSMDAKYPVAIRRTGRPTSVAPKTTWLRARVTPALRAEVIAAAADAKVSESQFVVDAVQAAVAARRKP